MNTHRFSTDISSSFKRSVMFRLKCTPLIYITNDPYSEKRTELIFVRALFENIIKLIPRGRSGYIVLEKQGHRTVKQKPSGFFTAVWLLRRSISILSSGKSSTGLLLRWSFVTIPLLMICSAVCTSLRGFR